MKVGNGTLLWNEETKTFSYLYSKSRHKANVEDVIAQHQDVLKANPTDVATRSMLAACLQASGKIEEAIIEWKQVADSVENHWSTLAKKVLHDLTSI